MGANDYFVQFDSNARDFATNRHARSLHLTASLFLDTTPGALECNGYLYATSSVRLRNP